MTPEKPNLISVDKASLMEHFDSLGKIIENHIRTETSEEKANLDELRQLTFSFHLLKSLIEFTLGCFEADRITLSVDENQLSYFMHHMDSEVGKEKLVGVQSLEYLRSLLGKAMKGFPEEEQKQAEPLLEQIWLLMEALLKKNLEGISVLIGWFIPMFKSADHKESTASASPGEEQDERPEPSVILPSDLLNLLEEILDEFEETMEISYKVTNHEKMLGNLIHLIETKENPDYAEEFSKIKMLYHTLSTYRMESLNSQDKLYKKIFRLFSLQPTQIFQET